MGGTLVQNTQRGPRGGKKKDFRDQPPSQPATQEDTKSEIKNGVQK